MIRILVVDDNIAKLNNIINEINEKCGENEIEIKYVSYGIDAYKVLKEENIDIMILDICFPNRPGEKPDKKAGIDLLKHIKDSNRYVYPRYVIALSQYEDLASTFSEKVGLIHSSLFYDERSNEWKIRLIESLNAVIAILTNDVQKRSFDYDIAVICALGEELEILRASCDGCERLNIVGDDNIYYAGTFAKNNKKIKLIMTSCTQMGMAAAATLATKMIFHFTPKYLVMTGIAAGIKGKNNYGDVVAAEYAWDYGAGKETIDDGVDKHKNTIQQICIDTDMMRAIRELSEDYEFLSKTKREFGGNVPDTELKLFLGPVASGASVISNEKYIQKVKDQIRDVIAVEMEIYGVYYAARWAIDPKPKYLALKSICDYGDEKKNDKYHKYASYTSAKVLEKLAKDYLNYD